MKLHNLTALIVALLLIVSSVSYAQATDPATESSDEPATPDTVLVVPTPKAERAEYFYAPPELQTALQLTYAQTPLYRTQTSTLPSGNYANDVTTSTSSVDLKGQYSFTKNFSLALDLQYRKDQNDFSAPNIAQSARASGLRDIALSGLYQLPTSFARYYFSLSGSISQQRSELATTTADGNETSGGWALRPAVGITKRLFVPSLRVGAELAGVVRGKRTQGDNQSPESDVTTTGAQSYALTVFGEYKFGSLFLAAAHVNAMQVTQASIQATGGTTFTGTADAYTAYEIGLDGYYYFLPWLNFKIGYSGTQLPARNINDSQGTTQVFVSTFNVAARFLL